MLMFDLGRSKLTFESVNVKFEATLSCPTLLITFIYKIHNPKHSRALPDKTVRKVNTVAVSHVGQMTCHSVTNDFHIIPNKYYS